MIERKPGLIRRFTCFMLGLLFSIVISGSGGCNLGRNANPSTAYRPPSPAPTPVDARANDMKVLMLDGTSSRMQDLLGNKKVVVLNFWATWCGPCRREIPELVALQREYKDKGVEVIGLSVDDPESKQTEVRDFAKQFSINYNIGFSSEEMLQLFAGSDDPHLTIPQTYIFDRNGRLLDKLKGFRRTFRTWAEGAVNYALDNP